jgi:cytochrome c553
VRWIVAGLILTLFVPVQAQAGDAAAGRKKALMCQTCHGLDGLAKQPNIPHLSGQVESYLVKSLMDFKEGLRANEMMSVVIQNLKDEDIADLAAYYASIKVTVAPPQ